MITIDGKLDVLLDGKIVGKIIMTTRGYHYQPKGSKKHTGELFLTLKSVVESLGE